jgi:pimeloyl-ACP methyl ester carboxylesterase
MDECKMLRLKNGGELAYAEYGCATGAPVLFFHGWPSSRTMAQLTDTAACELGVKIISADRPGIRDSSFQPNRKLIDWPQIVEQLADHLRIQQFRILAISGGAPYAGAIAGSRDCKRRSADCRSERSFGIAFALPPVALALSPFATSVAGSFLSDGRSCEDSSARSFSSPYVEAFAITTVRRGVPGRFGRI